MSETEMSERKEGESKGGKEGGWERRKGGREEGDRCVLINSGEAEHSSSVHPATLSPLSASQMDRGFRFLKGNVMFLSRPKASSKASQDTASSLSSLPPGAQEPLGIYKYQVPPDVPMEGTRAGSGGSLLSLRWLCSPSCELKPGSG